MKLNESTDKAKPVLVVHGGAWAIPDVMEEDDTFDAGKGSFLTRDGHVQMDAMIMHGGTMRVGGVGCVERVRNAIRLARLVLDKSPHVYIVADGAERFAEENCMKLIDN